MDSVSEAFMRIADLHQAIGLPNLKAMERWEYKIDENWWMVANGTREKMKAKPDGCMKATIPAYHAAIWWNGWLAGFLHPAGGTMAAGELANEDALIEALEKAIEREKS